MNLDNEQKLSEKVIELERRISEIENKIDIKAKPAKEIQKKNLDIKAKPAKEIQKKYRSPIAKATQELIDEGYFNKPITVSTLKKEYERKGIFKIKQTIDAHLRKVLVPNKILDRMKIDGTWNYVKR